MFYQLPHSLYGERLVYLNKFRLKLVRHTSGVIVPNEIPFHTIEIRNSLAYEMSPYSVQLNNFVRPALKKALQAHIITVT